MALRVRAAIAAILPSHHDSDPVHFHSGLQAQPVPCFEAACRNPRLSVD